MPTGNLIGSCTWGPRPGDRHAVILPGSIGSYVDLGNPLPAGPFTIFASIKLNDVFSGSHEGEIFLIHKSDWYETLTKLDFALTIYDGETLAFNVYSTTDPAQYIGRRAYGVIDGSVPFGTWFTIAITFSGTISPAPEDSLAIYANGVRVDSGNLASGTLPISFSYAPSSESLKVGEFNGEIDYLMLWSRALTAAEILDVHNDPYALFP